MVEFLIAGVQKGGTTALHAFLSQHPDLYLPARKELHFFDDESLDWSQPDYTRFHRHFRDRGSSQIAGEATPIYTYWQPAAARIHRYNAAMKLIVLLRNPVERAYSQWSMEFGRGTETLGFSAAIRGGRSRFLGGQHRVFSYVERGFYSEQVEGLTSLFPIAQLLFLRTEDLRERHRATLDRVCDFLGVGRFAEHPSAACVLPLERARVPPPTLGDLTYLRDLYRSDIERTEQRTGLDLSAWRARVPGM